MSDQLKEPENRFIGRIADLDEGDKPREKALSQGIRSLSNAELLAIIFWQWASWQISHFNESRDTCVMR